jgi:hypothetical protein
VKRERFNKTQFKSRFNVTARFKSHTTFVVHCLQLKAEILSVLKNNCGHAYFNIMTLMTDVGPCHRGMARPQVEDGGTASDMEGSCEYIK